jgi:iron complex outermembrane receptor protein
MRNILTLLISLVLAPLAALPLQALAQDPTAAGLEQVTVTAQRREQNLQDVPISVTAFTGEALQTSNIRAATEYLLRTPNVSYTEDGQSGSRGLGISIRGVGGMVSGENAFINTNGIYIDDFSVVSVPNQVANPELPDMERVEVLRGPQGTYFGRNAVGGALNLTTRRPTDEFGGELRGGFETYEGANSTWNVVGILNVPLSDSFRVRAVLSYEDNGGFVKNICAAGKPQSSCPGAVENNVQPSGAKDSGGDTTFGRFSADWDVSDSTSIKTTFFYTDDHQRTDENIPSGVLDIDSADSFGIGAAEDPGTGFWLDGNQNKLSHDLPEYSDNQSTIGILNISHNFNDNVVLRSITGFIDASLDRNFDNDLVGGMNALQRTNSYDGKSWSSELRLEMTEDSFDFITGLMYAHDEQKQQNNVAVSSQATATINGVGILPPFPDGLGLALNNKEFEVTSKAIFADFTYHATEKLDLTAGARYTDDEVYNYVQAFAAAPTCCFEEGGFPFWQSFVNVPNPVSEAKASFSDVTPRFVASYFFNDDVNVYGTISKGYKAGGSSVGNNTNQDGNPAFSLPFNEENMWNYELGFKSELMENRLRLNVSVFNLQWSDLQFESFRFLTPGDLSSNFEQTINIEDAEATGGEIELTAAITDGFTLYGTLGYLDSEITSNTNAELTGGFVVNLQGLDLPKAPKYTLGLIPEYRWQIADNEAWVRLEYFSRGSQYSDIEALTNQQTTGPSPNNGIVRELPYGEFPYKVPSFDLFNLRAGFNKDAWAFNFYVANLFEEEYYTGTQENFGVSGMRLRPHPRTFGLNVSYVFGGSEPAAASLPPPPPPPPAAPPANPDLDGDGVLNERDKCPNTRPGAVVDLDGCEVEAVISLEGVHFDFDKATLRPDAIAILDKAVGLLKTQAKVVVEVAGHTDSVGSEEYNQGLSERRANAVRDYLESQGITATRLTARGYGEAQPVASNDTDEGRAQNRRVELIVLSR